MKKLIYIVLLLLAATLLKPASASDLAKLYPEQLVETKNLHALAYDYFRGPESLPPGEILTPEMIKSPERQQAFYKMWQLLGLAIDDGQDISFMTEFGLNKIDGGYFVDYKKYPQWADMSALFMSLHTPIKLDRSAYYLRKKGFSNKGIEIFSAYLQKHDPDEEQALSEQKLLHKYTEHLTRLGAKQASTAELMKMHTTLQKTKHFSWNKWTVKLLNALSLQDQRILLHYLQERLGSMAIGQLPMTEESVRYFGDELRTGKMLTYVNNRLEKIRKIQND